MSNSKRYWENEKPSVFNFGRNQFRHYPKAGKLQVYPKVENSPHGVGRGATIDLREMTVEELEQLKIIVDMAVTLEIAKEKGEDAV